MGQHDHGTLISVLQSHSPFNDQNAQVQSLGRLSADTLLQLQTLHPERYPVLLESAATKLPDNNYDMLLAFPGERLTLQDNGCLQLPASLAHFVGNSFLSALDDWWQLLRTGHSGELPFHGGWFVFLGYELAGQIEPSVQVAIDKYRSNQPDIMAQAVRMPAAIVRDAITGEAWFVAEQAEAEQFALVQADIQIIDTQGTTQSTGELVVNLREDSPQLFLAAVHEAQEHIAAGDMYQANLSRGWSAELAANVSVQDIYRRLRTANPAPFAGLALLSDQHAIISSSPERLLQSRHGTVSTRPIAGTRSRSANRELDTKLIDELRNNPKEQAEHVMLLDLERNDLGRICQAGTVHVDEFMTVESYTHVHHIVSNVTGILRSDVTPGQAIAALFPGGTITGCPKLRCMTLIAELEGCRRGAYTGAMGYLNRDGSMDLNILIRTMELHGKLLEFRAGAGIVADSVPERELEEARAKALGLLRALS